MDIDTIVAKAMEGQELIKEEIEYAFCGYLEGKIKNHDMVNLLSAIVKKGMSDDNVFYLTDLFINSGETIDFEMPNTVDKHSTGGVGDKTTLIVGPICAALGLYVPKMSGRGLGHTGGTIDKLESIGGFKTEISIAKFKQLVKKNHFALMSQSERICPMDKKIYALRDISNTTKSIPLIASSIMSKKIACGAKYILIDVKYGSGALLENKSEAKELSVLMKKIGISYDRVVRTILTDMSNPLGNNIGNSVEIIEAVEILKNRGNKTLRNLCINIAANMLNMVEKKPMFIEKWKVKKVLKTGMAYNKFLDFITDQGGNLGTLKVHKEKAYILSSKNGMITNIDALSFGELSVKLGAGRQKMEDTIDHTVGIILNKQVGDLVNIGDILCTIYGDKTKIEGDVSTYFTIK